LVILYHHLENVFAFKDYWFKKILSITTTILIVPTNEGIARLWETSGVWNDVWKKIVWLDEN